MKQHRHRFCSLTIAFVLGIVVGAVVPVSAGTNFQSGACVEFADTLEPQKVWIPVGCELVDCCPGCPGNTINWRIHVSGLALESIVLRFDNLPAQVARRLTIKGKARWEGDSLRVWPGETVIRGFKYDPHKTPPVATPRLFGNVKFLRQLQETGKLEALATGRGTGPLEIPDREIGKMDVVVDQLMGEYVINEARIGYNLTRCQSFLGNSDNVTLNNNTSDDNAAVYLDWGVGNSCVNDRRFMGKGLVFVGDIRATSGVCDNEISVFSLDNAMAYVRPVFWTNSIFDQQEVTLGPLRSAPVNVWIVDDEPGTQERAEWEMSAANYYYNVNRVGIAFNATYRNVSNNSSAVNTISTGCSDVNRINSSDFYKPHQLNVYYVKDSVAGLNGSNCYKDPNIIFIHATPTLETLAHEIGHAFSLDHPNGCGSSVITTNNIMWEGESGRTYFSLGQAFRMNLNVTSMLNVNGVRVGLVRSPPCAEVSANDECPRLDLNAPF